VIGIGRCTISPYVTGNTSRMDGGEGVVG